MKTEKKILFHLGALFSVIVWGLSFVGTKHLLEVMTPMTIAVIRFVLSAFFMWIYLVLFNKDWHFKNIDKKDFKGFLLLGLFGYSLYFFLENTGMMYCSAGTTALIISTIPMFTSLFVSLRERKFKLLLYLGLVISFVGIYFIIKKDLYSGAENRLIGYLLIFGAVFAWVAYSFVASNLVKKYGNLRSTFYALIVGSITGVPMLAYDVIRGSRFSLDLTAVLILFFLSFICSILAYLTWNNSLSVSGEVVTNIYIYIIPVVAIIGEFFVLKVNITVQELLGALLIITGVIISQINTFKFKKKIRKNGVLPENF